MDRVIKLTLRLDDSRDLSLERIEEDLMNEISCACYSYNIMKIEEVLYFEDNQESF